MERFLSRNSLSLFALAIQPMQPRRKRFLAKSIHGENQRSQRKDHDTYPKPHFRTHGLTSDVVCPKQDELYL